MENVLLTGANGLLGSQIAKRLLRQGYNVRAIKRASSRLDLLGEDAARIQWVEGDVRDFASLCEVMLGIDKVIHCAALISFVPEDAQQMMQVNAEGTANVVNAALDSGIKRLLYVSSVAAFCRPKGVRMIDENLDTKDSKDNFNYYRSKFYAEREVWRGFAEGLNGVIICPSTILGGGFWDMEPNKLFAQIDKGYPFFTEGRNGFVDVRDVADVAIRLLNSEIRDEKFILSSENLSFRDLMWMIADALSAKRASFKAAKLLGEIAWRGEWLITRLGKKKPLVTKEVIDLALCDYAYSNTKICSVLPFVFRPVRETVNDVAHLYKQSVKEGADFGVFEL